LFEVIYQIKVPEFLTVKSELQNNSGTSGAVELIRRSSRALLSKY